MTDFKLKIILKAKILGNCEAAWQFSVQKKKKKCSWMEKRKTKDRKYGQTQAFHTLP